MIKLVIIESPFAGDIEENIKYARECMRDSLMRREYPFASHLLYTQQGILDDNDKKERQLGINAGFAWGKNADMVAVYTDKGISQGMKMGIAQAKKNGIHIIFRTLYNKETIDLKQ